MRSRPHRLRMPYRYLWGIFLFQFSPFGTKMVLKIAPGTKFGFCGPFRTASSSSGQLEELLFFVYGLFFRSGCVKICDKVIFESCDQFISANISNHFIRFAKLKQK